MLFPQRPVIGIVHELKVLQLGIPALDRVFEGLADEPGPIGNGGSEVADEDEVEILLEGPLLFGVVDFEFDVGGDPALMSTSLLLYVDYVYCTYHEG